MWTLLLGFLFIQQAIHTDVRLETKEISGFASEALCKAAGEKVISTYQHAATEPDDDYHAEDHDDKPESKEDAFHNLRPSYNCLQMK